MLSADFCIRGVHGGVHRGSRVVRDTQQPPCKEPEPEEPRDACSAYRRAVTDQAEAVEVPHDLAVALGEWERLHESAFLPMRAPNNRTIIW